MGPMPIPSSKAILRGLAENLNPHAPAPPIADLAAWLPRSPVEVWQAFGLSFVPITSGKPDRLDRLVIDFHETYVQWCQETSLDMKAAWREHPALVFVAGWQQRAVVVKPTRGAGLPRFQRMSEAEALALPGFDAQRPGPVRGQPVLPGFDVTPVGGCPVVAAVALRPSRRGHRTARPGRAPRSADFPRRLRADLRAGRGQESVVTRCAYQNRGAWCRGRGSAPGPATCRASRSTRLQP